MLTRVTTSEMEPFWNDVNPTVVTSLTDFQKDEILAAVSRRASANYPADVRLSLFGYFLVIIFGRERRSDDRLETERHKRPVFTLRNLPLIAILWGSVVYTAFSFILPGIKELLLLFI